LPGKLKRGSEEARALREKVSQGQESAHGKRNRKKSDEGRESSMRWDKSGRPSRTGAGGREREMEHQETQCAPAEKSSIKKTTHPRWKMWFAEGRHLQRYPTKNLEWRRKSGPEGKCIGLNFSRLLQVGKEKTWVIIPKRGLAQKFFLTGGGEKKEGREGALGPTYKSRLAKKEIRRLFEHQVVIR